LKNGSPLGGEKPMLTVTFDPTAPEADSAIGAATMAHATSKTPVILRLLTVPSLAETGAPGPHLHEFGEVVSHRKSTTTSPSPAGPVTGNDLHPATPVFLGRRSFPAPPAGDAARLTAPRHDPGAEVLTRMVSVLMR